DPGGGERDRHRAKAHVGHEGERLAPRVERGEHAGGALTRARRGCPAHLPRGEDLAPGRLERRVAHLPRGLAEATQERAGGLRHAVRREELAQAQPDLLEIDVEPEQRPVHVEDHFGRRSLKSLMTFLLSPGATLTVKLSRMPNSLFTSVMASEPDLTSRSRIGVVCPVSWPLMKTLHGGFAPRVRWPTAVDAAAGGGGAAGRVSTGAGRSVAGLVSTGAGGRGAGGAACATSRFGAGGDGFGFSRATGCGGGGGVGLAAGGGGGGDGFGGAG